MLTLILPPLVQKLLTKSEKMTLTTILKQMEKDNSLYQPSTVDQNKVLENLIWDLKDHNIHSTKLFIEHDGYDKHGPQSDLLDLVIWAKSKSGEHELRVYHTEEWYTDSSGPPAFSIYKVWTISEYLWSLTKSKRQDYYDYSKLYNCLCHFLETY